MLKIGLIIWLLSSVFLSTTRHLLTNQGNQFCIGIMRDHLFNDDCSDCLFTIIIGTESTSPVSFSLTFPYPKNDVDRKTVRNDPYIIPFGSHDVRSSNHYSVQTSDYNYREKGICISTNGSEPLFIIYYFGFGGATSSYLALPYQELLTDEYNYLVLSSKSSDRKYWSGFLLVGIKNNTAITIYPSIVLNIPQDTQNKSSINILVKPGENHTVILHRKQTLYVGKNISSDITGTRIVSDKPLTVISGHEAGSVPSDGTLEPMAQQIPPTQLWGDTFLIVPFAGHDKGQYIKVLASLDNTKLIYNCGEFQNETIICASEFHQFFVPSDTYCYLEANNSVLVGQFAASPSDNTDGDTTMVLVASLDQYSNSFFFLTLNESTDLLNHYISISVPVEYYQPNSILYDDNIISAQWTAIYDSGDTIVGYGCSFEVLKGLHKVTHLDFKGHLFVMVYGFTGHFGTRRAYAYPAGFTFSSHGALGLRFSTDIYIIAEGNGSVHIEILRQTSRGKNDTFLVKTLNIGKSKDSDYQPIEQDIVFPSTNSSLSISITIHDDNLSENIEQFVVQLCYMSEPLKDVCMEASVIIKDDDVITISPSQYYDKTTNQLKINAVIRNGVLDLEYTLLVCVNTTITLSDTNTNATFSSEMAFSTFHPSENVEYTIPKFIVDQSVLVITQLFVITEGIPVDTNPSVLSIDLQGMKSSTSTVLTSGTSTTGLTSSTSLTYTIIYSTGSTSSIAKHNYSSYIQSTTVFSTSSVNTLSSYTSQSTTKSIVTANNSDMVPTSSSNILIFSSSVQTGYYTNNSIDISLTSQVIEPSSVIRTSNENYKHILLYVGIAAVVIILIIMIVITTGMICYCRRKRKAQQIVYNMSDAYLISSTSVDPNILNDEGATNTSQEDITIDEEHEPVLSNTTESIVSQNTNVSNSHHETIEEDVSTKDDDAQLIVNEEMELENLVSIPDESEL